MSLVYDRLVKDLAKILELRNKKPTPYDTRGIVNRIDEDGTAWVHIPGGVDETPVKLTISAKEGDEVQLRVGGGRAWLTGNATNPPTDDTVANEAKDKAISAGIVAEGAQTEAVYAHNTAEKAYELAGSAKTSADGKNTIYRGSSQPTGGTYAVGDVWFDTAHDNKIHRYNGSSWVAVLIGDDALDEFSANHITAGSIDASQVTVSNLDAGNITTGTIDADRIDASTLIIGGSNLATQANVSSAVDGIQVGGRNLILNTKDERISPASSSQSAYVPTPILSDFGSSIMNNTDDFFTYSFDYEVTGNSATGAYIYVQARGTSVPSNSDGYSKNVYQNPTGHYCCKFHLTSAQASGTSTSMGIRLRNATDGAILKVRNIKCEFGNKETSWTPAPEDVDDAINSKMPWGKIYTLVSAISAGTTYANILYYASTTQRYAIDIATTPITNISDGDTVRLAYKVSDMTGTPTIYIVGTVTDNANQDSTHVKLIGHGIDTTVIDGGMVLTGKVAADRVDVNSITINDFSSSVKNEISNSNIKIGGQNILKKTQYMPMYSLGTNVARYRSGTQGFEWCLKTTGSSSDYSASININPTIPKDMLDGETTHVISFDYYISSGASDRTVLMYVNGTGRDVGNYGSRTKYKQIVNATLTVKGKWQRASFVINPLTEADLTIGSGDVNSLYFNFYDRSNGGNMYVKNFQLEKGNKATAYAPAPDDYWSGGENLLRGTYSMKQQTTGNTGWSAGTFYTSNGDNGTVTFNVTVSNPPIRNVEKGITLKATTGDITKQIGFAQGSLPIKKQEITFSVWAKGTAGDIIVLQPIWMNANSATPESGSQAFTIPDGSWHKYSWTTVPNYEHMTIDDDSSGYHLNGGYVYFRSATVNRTLTVLAPMLEYGTVASDWSPSSLDTDTEPSKVATDYVTQIDSNGIWVTPPNKKPTDPSTGAGATGTKIDGDGLQIFKGGASVASYGDTARVGKNANGASRAEIVAGGMQIYRNVSGTDKVLANIGYGSGNDSSGGTSNAPFYTFGTRKSGSAVGNYSVAEGYELIASGHGSKAEGVQSEAIGNDSYAGNYYCLAKGVDSRADGYMTTAIGDRSYASGMGTVASSATQRVIGKYNTKDTAGTYAFIVGNGTGGSDSARSNALALKWTGAMTIAGALTQNSDRRLKDHIDYLGEDAVEFIRGLKPAHYIKDDEHHVGFYAQDVEEIDKWDCMVGEMNGYKTLGYTEIIAPLVAYVQKLESRIEELERERK